MPALPRPAQVERTQLVLVLTVLCRYRGLPCRLRHRPVGPFTRPAPHHQRGQEDGDLPLLVLGRRPADCVRRVRPQARSEGVECGDTRLSRHTDWTQVWCWQRLLLPGQQVCHLGEWWRVQTGALTLSVQVGTEHDMVVNVWDWRNSCRVATNKMSFNVSAISFTKDGSYFVVAGNRSVDML